MRIKKLLSAVFIIAAIAFAAGAWLYVAGFWGDKEQGDGADAYDGSAKTHLLIEDGAAEWLRKPENNSDGDFGSRSPENEPTASDLWTKQENEPHEADFQKKDETADATHELRAAVVVDISEADAELPAILDAVSSNYNCAAVSLAFFDGEHSFYTYQYGFSDISAQRPVLADTKLRVASLAKLTTAIAAMALAEAGTIDLDADISQYLGYEVKNPAYPGTPITSRMLMQHTSSLHDSTAFISSRYSNSSVSTQRLLDSDSSYRTYAPPGTRHEYSNFGFAVLGAVCEKAAGEPFDTLTRKLVFTPLGIDAAYVPERLPDAEKIAGIYDENHRLTLSARSQLAIGESGILGHDHHLAQGNLTISALDYARILAMLANGGIIDGIRVLSEEAVGEIHFADVSAGHYMQGLSTRFQENAFMGDSVFWHTGSGFGTFTQYIYDMQSKRGVVVITTGASTGREANGMIKVCLSLSEPVWALQVRA